jgi:hypothetical protein
MHRVRECNLKVGKNATLRPLKSGLGISQICMVPITKILTVPCPTFEFKVVDQLNERSNKRLIEYPNEIIDGPVL